MDDISVLICDDSSLMRNVISRSIENYPGIRVVDKAVNGQDLINKIPAAKPDVIVLDIEMPVMNGIEFLKYRKEHFINVPVVVLSSIAEKGAAVTFEALELGASDFITKPNGSVSMDINAVLDKLIEYLAVYGGNYARNHGKTVFTADYYSKLSAEKAIERKLQSALGTKAPSSSVAAAKPVTPASSFASQTKQPSASPAGTLPHFNFEAKPAVKNPVQIKGIVEPGKIEMIAIGISTGGPNALREVFKKIDPNLKQPILVVQHMPAGFTTEFAYSLDKICPLKVTEAHDGDVIEGAHIYIAPGDYHIAVEKEFSGRYVIRTLHTPQRNGHRPSADVLFESVGNVFGNRALGVIMTGMGKDGAVELAEMRKKGAWTLGQDEKSAIVYGMPRVAWELGAVQKQVSLEDMADAISRLARENG